MQTARHTIDHDASVARLYDPKALVYEPARRDIDVERRDRTQFASEPVRHRSMRGLCCCLVIDVCRKQHRQRHGFPFQFEAVPPGDYELVAVPKAFFEAFRFEAKQNITVTSGKEVAVSLFLTTRTPTSKGNQ